MFAIDNRFVTRFPLLNPYPPSSRHVRPFRPWFSCFAGGAIDKGAAECRELIRHEVAVRVITVVISCSGRGAFGLRRLSQRDWEAVPRIADTNFLSIHRANGDPLGLQVCVHVDVRCLGVIPLAIGEPDSIPICSLRYLDLPTASKPTHHQAFVNTFVGFCLDQFMGIGRDLVAPCQCKSECERDDCTLHLFLPRRVLPHVPSLAVENRRLRSETGGGAPAIKLSILPNPYN
jgi:hypothetical protein